MGEIDDEIRYKTQQCYEVIGKAFSDLAKLGHQPIFVNGAAMGMCRKSQQELIGIDKAIEWDREARERIGWNTRAPQWQPIETAPKDGMPFIGYNPVLGVKRDVMWSFKRKDFDIHGWSGLDRNWTHWQPQESLPQPPEGTK